MSEEQTNGADIALEVGGQKVNLRNVKSLNTIATVATLILVVLLCYAFYMHMTDARASNQAFVTAIKEQTTATRESAAAQREQTCMMKFDQRERQANAEFCRQVSRRMYPRVLAAPAIPWGVSFHHMNFPGTITLSPELFMGLLVEIVGSLQAHGFDRFLIVNGHGGNIPALGVAVVRIQEEVNPAFIGAASYFSFADKGLAEKHNMTGITGHACEMETSVAKALIPEVVKTDALDIGDLTDLTYEFRKTLQAYNVTVPYRLPVRTLSTACVPTICELGVTSGGYPRSWRTRAFSWSTCCSFDSAPCSRSWPTRFEIMPPGTWWASTAASMPRRPLSNFQYLRRTSLK